MLQYSFTFQILMWDIFAWKCYIGCSQFISKHKFIVPLQISLLINATHVNSSSLLPKEIICLWIDNFVCPGCAWSTKHSRQLLNCEIHGIAIWMALIFQSNPPQASSFLNKSLCWKKAFFSSLKRWTAKATKTRKKNYFQ